MKPIVFILDPQTIVEIQEILLRVKMKIDFEKCVCSCNKRMSTTFDEMSVIREDFNNPWYFDEQILETLEEPEQILPEDPIILPKAPKILTNNVNLQQIVFNIPPVIRKFSKKSWSGKNFCKI